MQRFRLTGNILWYGLLFAFFIRLFLIPNPGFEADISFWKSWGLATYDFGIVKGLKVTNNNYPTPFAYILGAMVWIYSLLADPHAFNEFWKNTNILFLTISKSLPVLADFGIALLFLYIGKHAKRLGFPTLRFPESRPPDSGNRLSGLSFYDLLAIISVLNPIGLIDGAWWGQVDSLGVFFFLAAFILILQKLPLWAGVVYMIAMMIKLQNMIYSPIFFLFIWQTMGFTGLIRAIAGAIFAFLGLNIELIASHNADRILASLTENYDYFPWMSLLAYNLWWIVSGAKGLVTSDKLTVLGLLNAKTVGLLLFSSFYLLAILRQLLERKNVLRSFLESFIVVNAAFFLFQTQSHDRYAFPLATFLLLWAPFYVNTESEIRNHDKKKRVRSFSILYLVFSILYFYNLHTALAVNYPQNSIPFLGNLTQPVFTIGTAAGLLILFCVFLFTLARSSRVTVPCLLITGGVCAGSLIYLNSPLFTRQPVSLTKFTPYISEQSYGTRQTNKSVQSAFGGPHQWNRLSVQYLFYDKGFGTHANSKHVFDINKKFVRFTVDIGIDTESGQKSSAVFEIYGDDTLLYRSDTMGRFDLPRHADVDVSGVKHLTLITTDAGDGNYDDHTDWLHPVLWQ